MRGPIDGARTVLRRSPPPIQRIFRTTVVRTRYRGLDQRDLLTDAFPKSGSTWLRFILTAALTGHEIDFDRVGELSVALGRQRFAPTILPSGGRLIQSHERYGRAIGRHRLRVLYVVRDGRDVALSYFHHQQRRGAGWSSFDAFLDAFLTERVGPYGAWHTHVAAWHGAVQRSPESMMLIRYEDLLEEPKETLLRVDSRFGLALPEAVIEAAIDANSADRMRAKESLSKTLTPGVAEVPFVRAAKAGQWRSQFDERQLDKFEAIAGPARELLGYPAAGTSKRE